MNPIEPGTVLLLVGLLLGVGIFLRVVAKEKHRRERWLVLRLEEKIKQLKERQINGDDEATPIAADTQSHR